MMSYASFHFVEGFAAREHIFYERLVETVVSCFLRTEPLLKYQTLGLTRDKEHRYLHVELHGAVTRSS